MAAHPGSTLKHYMGYTSFSPETVAARSGVALNDIQGVCDETTSVSDAIATGLAKVFDRPKAYWLGLQSAFDAAQ